MIYFWLFNFVDDVSNVFRFEEIILKKLKNKAEIKNEIFRFLLTKK